MPPGRSASSSVRGGGGPGWVEAGERLLQRRAFRVALLQLLEAFACRLDRAGDRLDRVAGGRVRQRGLGDAAAAQLVVDGDDDAAQAFEVVGGDGLLARRVAAGEELRQGGVEGIAGGALGLGLVEDAEAGVDAGGDRVGGEDPVAEAVDGGDPGAADGREEGGGADGRGARPGGAAGQLGADPGAQLGGGLVGEGEGEDRRPGRRPRRRPGGRSARP